MTLEHGGAEMRGGCILARNGARVTLSNATVADCSAPTGAIAFAETGSTLIFESASLSGASGNVGLYLDVTTARAQFHNSVIEAMSIGGSGAVGSSGYNVFDVAHPAFASTGDLANAGAGLLAPLADNGGGRNTLYPLAAVLIDHCDPNVAPAFDARGVARSRAHARPARRCV